jgi:hypothetical protein
VSVGARVEELKNNYSALLHHKFFCKGEYGWWCRVIASLMPFMPLAVFVSSFYLFKLSCGPLVVTL